MPETSLVAPGNKQSQSNERNREGARREPLRCSGVQEGKRHGWHTDIEEDFQAASPHQR